MNSVLLIGNNGSGKSTIARVLEILQRIGRGVNRAGDLVKPKDLAHPTSGAPIRIQIELELRGKVFDYNLAFELPDGFKELRVYEERLEVDGKPVYTRQLATVTLAPTKQGKEAAFQMDWHLVALPVIQQRSEDDPLSFFKRWLARMLILRPLPALILGDANEETLEPDSHCIKFGAWFTGLLAYAPAAYSRIDDHLKQTMPDFSEIHKPYSGDSRTLQIQFTNSKGILRLPFGDLGDGEKCFMIGALVLASQSAYGPLFCFWDEPDNYLAPSEVGHFVMSLRKAFQSGGQFIATSHNDEAIRQFSQENTLYLSRKSHLEPTSIRSLREIPFAGDLVSALIRGDVEP